VSNQGKIGKRREIWGGGKGQGPRIPCESRKIGEKIGSEDGIVRRRLDGKWTSRNKKHSKKDPLKKKKKGVETENTTAQKKSSSRKERSGKRKDLPWRKWEREGFGGSGADWNSQKRRKKASESSLVRRTSEKVTGEKCNCQRAVGGVVKVEKQLARI